MSDCNARSIETPKKQLEWGIFSDSNTSIERIKAQALAAARPLGKFSRFIPPPKPLTSREKLQFRLLDYRNRIALALAALRGERMVREDDLP